MPKVLPQLVTFGLSHFCEKARWGLDWHGIEYEEISWAPGVHQILAKRCGADQTTVPILLDGDVCIQGSNKILDWADKNAQDGKKHLTHSDAGEIEERADEVIGPQVRRLIYAETLPQSPEAVKPALFRNTSTGNRILGNMMWPVTRRVMMRMYEISPSAASESRSKLEDELDWLDGMLSDGRRYLAGDRFSRADVAVASLLAPFARPQEMSVFREISLPMSLQGDCERWRDRPTMTWVRSQYRDHR